eukprot:TRINITY_DN11155_c0_g1_i1.p1 TRINITY_DN11155_c0_g1~~TRINITY_DN11155_c0_g1_i1.p1  ORF type:complete len:191 (+),score=37.40 TRINITY_DN11155_c0_g1_i1:56-628(+)
MEVSSSALLTFLALCLASFLSVGMDRSLPDVCYSYRIAQSGSAGACGVGEEVVPTRQLCHQAAAFLRRTQGSPFDSKRSWCNVRPRGCYFSDKKGVLFWNPCPGREDPPVPSPPAGTGSRYIVCKTVDPLPTAERCAVSALSSQGVRILAAAAFAGVMLLRRWLRRQANVGGGGAGCGDGGGGCGGGGGG